VSPVVEGVVEGRGERALERPGPELAELDEPPKVPMGCDTPWRFAG